MQNPYLVNALRGPRINPVSLTVGNPNVERVASEDEIARQRELAKAFAAQSAGTQRIESPWQGANQLAQAAIGGIMEQRAASEEQKRREAVANALTGAIGSDTASTLGISEDQMRQIIALNPEFGQSLLTAMWQERMKPKEEKGPIKLGKDDTLLDPNTYEPLYKPSSADGPIRVGQGDTLLDPSTYEPIYKPASQDDAKPSLVDIADPNNPGKTVKAYVYPDGRPPVIVGEPPAPEPPKPTPDIQNYEYYAAQERAAGREPLSPLEYEQAIRKSGATSITTNVGATEPGAKYHEGVDSGLADTHTQLYNNGMTAASRLQKIDRLDALLANIETGGMAALKQLAGNYGIATEGLDDIQAAQALINQLVPEQRPVGSGPMSDADLELFKQSMPRLINTPGGNALITQTLRGIAEYDRAVGEIAARAIRREIDPFEADRLIWQVPDPLAAFNAAMAGQSPQVPGAGNLRAPETPMGTDIFAPPVGSGGPLVIDGYTIERIE